MVWVTFFDDIYGRSLQAEDLTLEQLFDRIRAASAPAKAALPLLKLARFGSLRTPPPANSLRNDQNVSMVSGLEGDYDREKMPFQEAVDRLEAADVEFVAYTSPSNTPATPRWRVLLPFAKEVAKGERGRLMNWLNGLLGGELSRESWGVSQAFYYGGINGPPAELHLGDSERCIDEADFEALAQPCRAAPGDKTAAPDFDDMDEAELLAVIESGAHYWGPAKRLLAMWARQGISPADAEGNLADAFDQVPTASRGKKWGKNKKSIPRWVKDCYARALKAPRSAAFVGLLAALDAERQWKRAVMFNSFTECVEVCTPFPPQPGQTAGFYRALEETDVLEALAHFQSTGCQYAKKGTVWDVVVLSASRNKYHPVRDWLKGLADWDGSERDTRLFLDYFPGKLPDEQDAKHRDEVTAYYEHTAMCFLVGLVARVFEPGAKVDTLPALVGAQGLLKSQGLAALMPDPAWFTDDLAPAVSDRDAKESLTGKWLVELAEFPHVRKDIDKFKAFASRQSDRYRRAYGRLNTDHPRQCGFCATANELEFLDITGNRRIWPIPLAGRVDVEAIRRGRDQIWAQALYLYDQGYEWWLSPSLEAIAAGMQDAFVEADIWDELILEALDSRYPVNSDGERPPFPLRGVLKEMGFCFTPGQASCATKADEMRAARRLRRLGYQRDPHRHRGSGQARFWVPVKKLPH